MDYLFPQKNAPLQLSRYLRQLIETIGQTKSKQQQNKIINFEIKYVKQQLQGPIQQSQYPDILVKLIYFKTLGYNVSFANILPINLCQSPNHYVKKMAYLLSAMLVKPGQKLALLMNNTLLKDLQSDNSFTKITSLSMLRYYLNQDIIPEVQPFVRKLLKDKMSMIRRKSLLAMYNIYELQPKEVEDIKNIATQALSDPDVPVIFAAVSVLKRLVSFDPISFKSITTKLTDILNKIMNHQYPPQYDYHKVPAPWVQIDILQMLEKLGHNDQTTSKLMYDCLEKCMRRAGNFYMHLNYGIIQQCIKTIAAIYPHQYLLQECERHIDGFFSEGTINNMKSFGLSAMIYLAKSRPEIVEKWQYLLVECLESKDNTIAQRTITLLIEIANETNTQVILNKIMTLTEKSTDSSEKRRLIKNAIYLIERFSNQKQIFLRRMNQIFYKFEDFISEASINNFLKTLVEMVDLEPSFIDLLIKTYIQIIENFRNQTLVKVSSWIIGELTHKIYLRDKNSEDVDRSIDAILCCAQQYIQNQSVTLYIVSSLMKLSPIQMTSRHNEIKGYLKKLESQQNYFVHKLGEEFIRMAKYSKALCSSQDITFDPKMKFLAGYIDRNYEDPPKNFLLSKSKYQKMQKNDLDLLNSAQPLVKQNNIFQFHPGQRWGRPEQTNKPQKHEVIENQQVVEEKEENKKFILRGPHQQKRTKPKIDEKKAKLAKSIFGNK